MKVWLSFQSVNQSIIINFTAHKCMPKNFRDYLGNKVTFLKWADNGLLLAKFIKFFCRVLVRHYCNKFRKLIAKYSNDLKDHKGYKLKRILPFASVMLSSRKSQLQWWLPRLPWLSNCLSLFYMELMKREWIIVWPQHKVKRFEMILKVFKIYFNYL